MLHAYNGGPEPTPIARRLDTYSHWRKLLISFRRFFFLVVPWSNSHHFSFVEMEAAKQRAQVRAVAVRRKKEENKAKRKEGASSSAPKVIGKGMPKRKVEGKDDHPPKKVSVTPGDKLPKKLSPSKPSYGADKGLMTMSGLVTQGLDCHLVTHKDYIVEVIESIIKDKDVDPCAEK